MSGSRSALTLGPERTGPPSPSPTNTAAWLVAKKARLDVGSAPYTPPRAGEIVVKNHAVAINPLDWMKQVMGDRMFSWISYPFVMGSDLAGEVVEVGAGVTRFRVGDRVLGHAVGMDKKRNASAEGAFQTYTVLLAHMASPIPDAMSYEDAAVLPLGLSTAACALFQTDQLALRHPVVAPEPTGETVLVWGGSTSVGSNAIQLAVAAGYDVVTTASPQNAGYVSRLGAGHVFDYSSATVVDDLVKALRGTTIAGALAVGTGSAAACSDVVHACTGAKFVAMASPAVSFERGPTLAAVLRLVSSTASLTVSNRRRGVRTRFLFGTSLMGNEVGSAIYVDFLPRALAEGRYVAAPAAKVIGTGLEHIQAGLDVHKKGVSATKIVVSL